MGIPIPVLLNNLVGLFLLLGAGFVSARLNLVSQAATPYFTALLMKVTLPATIFMALQRPFDPAFLKSSVVIFSLHFGLFLLYALLSPFAAGLLRVRSNRGVWTMCCTFCNNGFMGYPVVLALFGEEGLALAVMGGISFNLLVYSLGAKQILRDEGDSTQITLSLKSLLLTNVNAATLLGLAFFCLQLQVPEAVLTPIRHLSNVTTPLSMFMVGMTLARGSVADAFKDRDVFSACFMRLLALPVITWGLLQLLSPADPLVTRVTLIIMSMPAPAISAVLSEQYGRPTAPAARIVFLSSLLCIATIPLVAMLP